MKIPGFKTLDKIFIQEMHKWAIPLLRIAVGVIYVWFGGLKVIGLSPVAALVESTFGWVPVPYFFEILGLWEVVIGVLLLGKVNLRFTLGLLWLHMLGVMLSPFFNPGLFFVDGNPLILTTEGQYVIKNFILIAAGLAVGGYEVESE
jgi:uncharacterized membrane protein YkgB